MQGFNVADYADDNNELLSCGEIDDLCHPHMFHLLISGWSKDENVCVPKIESEVLQTLYSLPNGDGFISCLDLSLDPLLGEDEHSECDIKKLKNDIDACLEYFHNEINIALVYKEKEKEENSKAEKQYNYDYQKRIKIEDDLEEVIRILKNKIQKLRDNGILKESEDSKTCCSKIREYCLGPGIEKASEQIKKEGIEIIENKAITILDELRKEVNNINFEYPGGVLSEFSQLFYHPNYSFPLPIRLRFKPLFHVELWKSKDWSPEKNSKNDKILNTPVLGYYTRDNEDGCKGPHIVLCPLNIEKAAAKAVKNELNVDENLLYKLYKIVLIHELAHARMDAKRNEDSMKSIFAHAMEESLANMLTLQCFKEYYDQSVLDRVKSFVNTQDDIYKFGINQFEAKVDWTKWRDSYKDMHGELEVWFKECFEDPKLTEPDAVRSAYDSVFNRTKNKRQSHKSIKK